MGHRPRDLKNFALHGISPEGEVVRNGTFGNMADTRELFRSKSDEMNGLIFYSRILRISFKTMDIQPLMKDLRYLFESKRPLGTIPNNHLSHLKT